MNENPFFFYFKGKPSIRIDDPKSIIFIGEKLKDVCRFCGKEDSTYECPKCHEAKYCSKECQIYDWNVLKHKMICTKWKSTPIFKD